MRDGLHACAGIEFKWGAIINRDAYGGLVVGYAGIKYVRNLQVLSVSSTDRLLHSLVENSACRVNCGTYYQVVRRDSPKQFFGGQESLAGLHDDRQYPFPDKKQPCQNVSPTCGIAACTAKAHW